MKRSKRLLLIVSLSVPCLLAAAFYHHPPMRNLLLELLFPVSGHDRQVSIFRELRDQGALDDQLLASAIAPDRGALLRAEALETLANRPGAARRALAELQAIYSDPAGGFKPRLLAARAIAALGDDAAPAKDQALRILLGNRDADGRRGAIVILAALAKTQPDTVEALYKAAGECNRLKRAAHDCGVADAAQTALLKLSKDPDPAVRERVRRALEAAGNAAAAKEAR